MKRTNSIGMLQDGRREPVRLLVAQVVGMLVLLCFGSGESARAAFFSSSVVVDLSQVSITNDGHGGQLILGTGTTLVSVTSFTPQVGDVLSTAITFANADRLRINNGVNVISDALNQTGPDYFESLTFYFDGAGAHSSSTTTVSFNDLQGHLSNLSSGGTSNGVLAQSIYNFTDNWISFSGLTLTTTITALPNPGTQAYQELGLWGGRAGGFEVISGAAVPEPASLAMWGLGAVGIVIARRKRKQHSLVVCE